MPVKTNKQKTDAPIEAQPVPLEPVLDFMRWYLTQTPVIPLSQFAGVNFVGDFALLTLFRQDKYQVQLTLCRPGAFIPEHTHPLVDSVVIYVTGEIDFVLNGENIYPHGAIHALPNGICSQNSHWVRVKPGWTHSAKIGPRGGAFMTVQYWPEGKVESVEMDWVGMPLSYEHSTKLQAKKNSREKNHQFKY